jgi:hypothetical protein
VFLPKNAKTKLQFVLDFEFPYPPVLDVGVGILVLDVNMQHAQATCTLGSASVLCAHINTNQAPSRR